MPFLSEAQRKYMHKNHPDIAERWEKETQGKLPKHVKKSGAAADSARVLKQGGSARKRTRKTTKAPSRKSRNR